MALPQWTLRNLLLALSVCACVFTGLFVCFPFFRLNPLSIVFFTLALIYGLFGRGYRRLFWTVFAFAGWIAAFVHRVEFLSIYWLNLWLLFSTPISSFAERFGWGIELAAFMRICHSLIDAFLAGLVSSGSCLFYRGLGFVPPGRFRRCLIGGLLVGAVAGILICLNVLATEAYINTYSRAAIRAILLLPVIVSLLFATFGWVGVKLVDAERRRTMKCTGDRHNPFTHGASWGRSP